MIGILSDAHGNGPAFDLGIKILREYGAKRFIFLGDAFGYIPNISVFESIEELGEQIACIRGNHEEMLLQRNFDNPREKVYQLSPVLNTLDKTQLKKIKKWPRKLNINCKAGRLLFVHGSPTDPTNGYVYPDTDLKNFLVEADFIFMGHTHHPFCRLHNNRIFVNVGSCGLPRDVGCLGSMALFDEINGKVRLLRYDIKDATLLALASNKNVHDSVIQIYSRKRERFEGEIVEK